MDEEISIKLEPTFYDSHMNKKNYMTMKNSNGKIITFTCFLPDYLYDPYKRLTAHELLKMEVKSSVIQKIFRKLHTENGVYSSMQECFWSMKLNDTQLVGLKKETFFKLIRKLKGYSFVYPLMNQTYYIIFSGITSNLNSYRLTAYFNNCHYAYIDIINRCNKIIKHIDANATLVRINKIRIPDRIHYDIEKDVPHLVSTMGYKDATDYYSRYYFVTRSNIASLPFINRLSHLIVWSNDLPIRYNETKEFLFTQEELIEFDETVILGIRTVPKHDDDMINLNSEDT